MGEQLPNASWYRYNVADSLAIFAVLAEDEAEVTQMVTDHCKTRLDFLQIETNTLRENICTPITGEEAVYYNTLTALQQGVGELVILETFSEDRRDAEEQAINNARLLKRGDKTNLYQPKLFKD